MDLTYHIVGGNGQTYGPVSLAKMQEWVREGRVVADTFAFRSDQPDWVRAEQLSELGWGTRQRPLTPASAMGHTNSANLKGASPPPPALPPAAAELIPQIKSGAAWFYWIAGLSLVNTILAVAGQGGGFIIGLGITRVFDALASEFGWSRATVLAQDLFIYGLFVGLGLLAMRRRLWPFVVGTILYGLDALIYVWLQDWLAAGFHAFALFFALKGAAACREYRRLTS